MATRRPCSGLSGRLQVSKLCAVAVGVLGWLVELIAPGEEPALLLTVVGLALAGVVSLEAAAAVSGLVRPTRRPREKTPVGYRAVRTLEASVAICVLGGLVVWLAGPADGRDPLGWLSLLAAGMVTVSLVRATVAQRYSNR